MAIRVSGRAAEDNTDSDDSIKEKRPNLHDVEKNVKKSENKMEHKNKQRTKLTETTAQTSVPRTVGVKRRGKQPTSSPKGDSYSQHLRVITIDDHYEQRKRRCRLDCWLRSKK